ncbi:MAG: putative ABC transporter permease [Bacilli bacterium]
MYYLNCFLFYSIFGYLLETILAVFSNNNFQSGIMYGPWTPIYGIGVISILLLSNYFFINLHMNVITESIIIFIISTIFLSCLEVIGGIVIEKMFDKVFWSYSDLKYNIGNYISIEMSLLWGLATIIFIYILNPVFKNFIKKIPHIVSFLLSFAILFDLTLTIITKFKK